MKYTWKKPGIVAILLVLCAGLIGLPTARGAVGGLDDIGLAPTLQPGVYTNEYRYEPGAVYYNVSGRVGANLTVIITAQSPDCSQVRILAPNGTPLAIDTGTTCASGFAIVSVICDSTKLYTIEVASTTGFRGPVQVYFTLTIYRDGSDDGGIPGFDLLLVSFGILTLLGIVLLSSQRTKQLR